MKWTSLFLLFSITLGNAQTRLEMPMQGDPWPQTTFELVNKIPASKFAKLPKALPSYAWSNRPRDFSTTALQKLLNESVFAGTNIASLFPSSTNRGGNIKLTSRDNQDYFIMMPSAGRILIHEIDRSRDYPPPDAVPNFDSLWRQMIDLAQMLGVSTNDMERKIDGSIHIRKTENTTSHLGGAVKYKSKRSVTVFRSIDGYLLRSLDQDKIELECGINGRLLDFNFQWPNITATHTNPVLSASAIMSEIKNGQVLGDVINEYPSGAISKVELTDFQVFYYVATMLPYGRHLPGETDIRPMIELLATFKAKDGEATEGSLFVPLTQSP
ncbi:MAG TPA: hypothetical protein VMO20_09880 [Candidatus Acidoferrum sp.]|jgi:hypothetical protein|nr:hypothetical protein [Candidatus Acidoferrum sp.]